MNSADTCILKRVEEYFVSDIPTNWGHFITFSIIDLETTGLDYKKDHITEIGLIQCSLNVNTLELVVTDIYEHLNDPGIVIPENITKLTGITNGMVRDKYIDWEKVYELIKYSDFIVCHNAAFDRKFLEQVALPVANNIYSLLIFNKPFACSKNDIDWLEKGHGSNKLKYLNFEMGYFYDAHRAINDCWATLNILVNEEDALEELMGNISDEYRVYASRAPYSDKDVLKNNSFYWDSDIKSWFKTCKDYKEVLQWLKDNNIDCTPKILKLKKEQRYSSVQDLKDIKL